MRAPPPSCFWLLKWRWLMGFWCQLCVSVKPVIHHRSDVCRVQITWIADKSPKAILSFRNGSNWSNSLRSLQHHVSAPRNDFRDARVSVLSILFMYSISLYFVLLYPVRFVTWAGSYVYYSHFFAISTATVKTACLNMNFGKTRLNRSLLLGLCYMLPYYIEGLH